MPSQGHVATSSEVHVGSSLLHHLQAQIRFQDEIWHEYTDESGQSQEKIYLRLSNTELRKKINRKILHNKAAMCIMFMTQK